VSTIIMLAAIAVLSLAVGRLSAQPRIRRLDDLLHLARHAAEHDQLTGLPNRALAAKTFQHQQANGHTTLVLIDLDHFKQYGHATGDDLLRVVADRLATATATHAGTAARLGGDEFLLLLPIHANPSAIVEQILHILAQPVRLHTSDGPITVEPSASAGIARDDGTGTPFTTMLHHADIALFNAKQERGIRRTYSPELRMPHASGPYRRRLRDTPPTDNGAQSGGEATA
jgi:diguanylate cyclase (GGDEF)-like protein